MVQMDALGNHVSPPISTVHPLNVDAAATWVRTSQCQRPRRRTSALVCATDRQVPAARWWCCCTPLLGHMGGQESVVWREPPRDAWGLRRCGGRPAPSLSLIFDLLPQRPLHAICNGVERQWQRRIVASFCANGFAPCACGHGFAPFCQPCSWAARAAARAPAGARSRARRGAGLSRGGGPAALMELSPTVGGRLPRLSFHNLALLARRFVLHGGHARAPPAAAE